MVILDHHVTREHHIQGCVWLLALYQDSEALHKLCETGLQTSLLEKTYQHPIIHPTIVFHPLKLVQYRPRCSSARHQQYHSQAEPGGAAATGLHRAAAVSYAGLPGIPAGAVQHAAGADTAAAGVHCYGAAGTGQAPQGVPGGSPCTDGQVRSNTR